MKRKTTRQSQQLFPRRIRVPARVQASADLWLDMFMSFCDGLIARGEGGEVNASQLTSRARELADSALHEFESRWPGTQL